MVFNLQMTDAGISMSGVCVMSTHAGMCEYVSCACTPSAVPWGPGSSDTQGASTLSTQISSTGNQGSWEKWPIAELEQGQYERNLERLMCWKVRS